MTFKVVRFIIIDSFGTKDGTYLLIPDHNATESCLFMLIYII